MRAIAVVLAVGACYSPTPPSGAPCGDNDACPSGQQCVAGICNGTDPSMAMDGGGDGGGSSTDDATPLCTTWNARHFAPCDLPTPIGDLTLTQDLSDYELDTETGELRGKMNTPVPVATMVLTQPDGPDVMLLSVNNFVVEDGAYLDVNGTRGVVIAVNGTASIAGTLDLRANGATPGPGGFNQVNATYCATAGSGMIGSGAGGGGGGFGGTGGGGGNGSGSTAARPVPAVVRGGCAGGVGAAGTGGSSPRGSGGGAIQISARESITVSGTIGAGGGYGGYGRAQVGGGSGGGSGGYIGLQAPTITVTGTLAANGGGGGGGASDAMNGANGNNGANSANAAAGGAPGSLAGVIQCGRGGNGSSGTSLDGENGALSQCGGGGGGGGAGYILFWSSDAAVSGTVSPPALDGPT